MLGLGASAVTNHSYTTGGERGRCGACEMGLAAIKKPACDTPAPVGRNSLGDVRSPVGFARLYENVTLRPEIRCASTRDFARDEAVTRASTEKVSCLFHRS